jgi:hypothetical protein
MNFFGNNFVGSLVRKANRYDQSFESLADLLFWNVGNTLFKVIAIIIIISFFYPILGLIILIFGLNLFFPSFVSSSYSSVLSFVTIVALYLFFLYHSAHENRRTR